MNGFQGAALGLGKGGNNTSGSPVSAQSLNSPVRAKFIETVPRRKRLKVEGSPESAENWDGDESRIGVKRACNECRQQKVPISNSVMHPSKGIHWLMTHLGSCDAMWYRSPSRCVRDVKDAISSAGSTRPSKGLASARRMPRWNVSSWSYATNLLASNHLLVLNI